MKIATVRGIGVYIHWSFWLLMIFYLFPILVSYGASLAAVAALFLTGIFAAIVAHEFGHAAAAGLYGIKTADITLLPTGGLARLTELPRTPKQEIVIALAGPAVNLVIAAVLYILVLVGVVPPISAPTYPAGADIFSQWIFANCFLCCFNLLPAFPMDGGRVLRSVLAMKTSHLRATEIAARVGRWMALGFVIAAIGFEMWPLILLAIFVFIAGTAELMQVRFREMVKNAESGAQPGTGGFGGFGQAWPGQAGYGNESQQPMGEGDVIDAIDVREIE